MSSISNVTFGKNDCVAFHTSDKWGRPLDGYRRMTDAEVEAWYEARRGTMRDDGESHLCSGWTTVKLDGLYTVTRARVAPQIGWHKHTGMVEVMDANGVTIYAKRSDVAGIQRA